MISRLRNALVGGLVTMACLCTWSQTSFASLIQQIDAGSFGTGVIEFSDPVSGDETDIVAFSFMVPNLAGINDVVFGLSDVDTASYTFLADWIIDINSFRLEATTSTSDFDFVGIQFGSLGGPGGGPDTARLSYVLPGGQNVIGFEGEYSLTPIHVPEPSILVLSATALLVLGLAGRL